MPARQRRFGSRWRTSGLASSLSGATDANGTFAFDFEGDVTAVLPGVHGYVASLLYGGRSFSTGGAYEVAVA